MSGTLYIVATPIGNLEDLTPRARQILGDVDQVAAEDTRHTSRLLTHIGAKTPQIALHDFNEESSTQTLLQVLLDGADVAVVSDAGTPLISDPGFRLVAAAHAADIRVVPIPGASAVLAALSVSGLPTDRFCFEGFLPAKAGARRQRLEILDTERRTMIFFESVHRVGESLAAMAGVFGPDRKATLARELTKLFEEVRAATLGELAQAAADGSLVLKGEFVIVVAGAQADQSEPRVDYSALLDELVAALPGRQAAAIVARVSGEPRNAVYKRMLEIKQDK